MIKMILIKIAWLQITFSRSDQVNIDSYVDRIRRISKLQSCCEAACQGLLIVFSTGRKGNGRLASNERLWQLECQRDIVGS